MLKQQYCHFYSFFPQVLMKTLTFFQGIKIILKNDLISLSVAFESFEFKQDKMIAQQHI